MTAHSTQSTGSTSRPAITYASAALGRVITTDALMQLEDKELNELYTELLFAKEGLDETLADEAGSADVSSDWLHKVKTKRRICNAFLEHTKLRMAVLADHNAMFRNVYLACFERVVADEVGPNTYAALVEEATEEARGILSPV